jgi:hypothetical protein
MATPRFTGRPTGRPAHRDRIRAAANEVGDEQEGIWSRERLEEMNQRFVERLERAFETGTENRQAAAAMNGANASRPL